MPIIKSAIKRARQTVKRRKRNLKVMNAVKQDVRAAVDAIATGESKTIITAMQAAQSEIDRAVKKGTLHKNTAARRKSRLAAKAVLAAKPVEKIAKPKTKSVSGKKISSKKTTVKKSTAKK